MKGSYGKGAFIVVTRRVISVLSIVYVADWVSGCTGSVRLSVVVWWGNWTCTCFSNRGIMSSVIW